MSLPHVSSGEIVDIRPLDQRLKDAFSNALLRTERLEVMRLVLPAGKSFPEHHVDGESTIQCIEGVVELHAHGSIKPMRANQMVYLGPGVRHALVAQQDASVLVTILRNQQLPHEADDSAEGLGTV
ncbi:MAG: cupin protein [Paucimonas sp.]|nr:cupin protein [Paucimonas sp.]